MVINVVDTHRLQPTSFDKKSFITYIKAFMARIKPELESKNPSRVAPFMKGAEIFVKKIVSHFDEYDFYLNEVCLLRCIMSCCVVRVRACLLLLL